MPTYQREIIETSRSLVIDFNSQSVYVLGAEAWAVQLVWTASAVGVFYLESSLDNTNWSVEDSYNVTAAGCKIFYSLPSRAAMNYLRLRWDETGGSSTGAVNIIANVIGTFNE